ncbi:MAG: hypothetical protein AAF502_01810 [Bacteroidota bacterium]
MRVRIFTLILLFFLPLAISAQTLQEFSESHSEFLKELDGLMNATKREDCKLTYEEFKSNLQGGAFSAGDFEKLREVANEMLKRKMRAHPYFNSFLTSLNAMIKYPSGTGQFDDYMLVLKEILSNLKPGKYSPYRNYTNFASEFFKKNALYYTKSGAFWRTTATDIKLKFEDNNPYVILGDGDLIGKRKSDSIIIHNTAGKYYPLDFKWKGDKGSVSWERTGLSNVYSEFGSYSLETKKTGYQVDSVTFFHSLYFSEPITGRLEDKIIIGSDETAKSYPRFQSSATYISVENIGDGIEYNGGFGQFGPNVMGRGDKDVKARFFIYNRNGDLAVMASSQSFQIKKGERIVSKDAEVSMYFDADSIYHPSTNFKYLIREKDLTIARGTQGSSETPFFNSNHKFDMIVETIDWNIESDSIEVGKGKLAGFKRSAIFESLNFFNDNKYRVYQNIADRHPISIIKVYCEERSYYEGRDVRELDANLVATRLNPRYQLSTIMSLLNSLVEGGFIYYDAETEIITVKDKLFHWADASVEKVDHDVIRFASSSAKETNGIIDLSDNALHLRGVKNIVISDSQLTVVKPFQDEITLREDRDMEWAGQVYSGFGIFTGRSFDFDYNNFNMQLDSVDSFIIRLPEGEDIDGTPLLRPITTQIENTSGSLQIDAPGNKSGKENIHEYPSFKTNSKAYTYYADTKGEYSRDEFYFELEPFEFDSLDNFDPAAVGFDGKMVSAGIFPEFDERLIIQEEDYSLGFKTLTPQEGYELYKGKGKYNLEISLSSDGLTGKGTVTYLGSTLDSEDIVFLPESLTATAKTFSIKEESSPIEYPEVNAEDVNVTWSPYKDSMYIKSKDDPFLFFDNEKKLDGDLVLTPGGLYGSGVLDWDEATMESDLLLFGTNGVDADTCNLSIKSLDPDKLAFNTKNVKASLDFDIQRGTFEANSDDISTEMPYNQYKTSLNTFEWDMKDQTINFESKDGRPGSFLSTRKDQDSLLFTATSATYSLETNLLEIEGVPLIKVADATIYPIDGKVSIKAEAEMVPLIDAKIVANNTNKYHTINNAEVRVLGKYNYRASGNYEYNVGSREQVIKFDNINVKQGKKVRGDEVTIASGLVNENDDFYVDNSIKYRGTVNLQADSRNLAFDGYAKLLSPQMSNPSWFSINSKIDRNDVVISYEKPRDVLGNRLHVGLAINQDSVAVYPRVMEIPWKQMDHKIFTATGVIKHDRKNNKFLFGDSSKVVMGQTRGNLLTFNEASGKISMEGQFDFDKGFKNNIVMDAAGTSVTFHKGGPVSFNLIMGLNLPIPEKCMLLLANDLYEYGDNLPDVDNFDDWVKGAITELVADDKKLVKTFANMDNELEIALPKEVNYNIFFNKFPMKWNEETLSLTTAGSVGIGTINGKGIHKVIKCKAEVLMLPTGDIFTLYIESPSDHWYYFSYKNGLMKTLSSNEQYNQVLLDMKKKDSKIKMPNGDAVEVTLDNTNSVNYFRSRMRSN